MTLPQGLQNPDRFPGPPNALFLSSFQGAEGSHSTHLLPKCSPVNWVAAWGGDRGSAEGERGQPFTPLHQNLFEVMHLQLLLWQLLGFHPSPLSSFT